MKEFDDFFSGHIEKTKIIVPPGIKYISDWEGFSLPQGHCIIDKTICGCGFTEWCLRNDKPVILCSPRKTLLKNKEEQHNYTRDESGNLILNPDPEYPVYYFRNEKEAILDYDAAGLDVSEIEKLRKESQQEKQDYLVAIKTQMMDWLTKFNLECYTRHNRQPNPKILVTYDSLKHVVDALGEDLFKFSVVVDEFQSIFIDALFKSNVELDFVELLKSYPSLNVTYVSATPMMDRYLGSINYFPQLPYYELDWGDRVEKISIERIQTRSLVTSCVSLINSYKSGLYPIKVAPDKTVVESHEVIFYVNSVKTICDIIRKAGLKPEEVNIICADMASNKKRLRKLGKGFGYGSIPTDPRDNKMFTFCTRTAYLGADFYSTNAYTVVCSDVNVKTLNVDITLDLPQIVGRQRMKENIFRDEVKMLYVAKNKDDIITLDEFMAEDNKKENETGELLSTASLATAWVKKGSRDKEIYLHDYVGFRHDGSAEYNYLVKVAYIRAFEISRKDYQENILVKRNPDEIPDNLVFGDSGSISSTVDSFVAEFKSEFEADNNFERRMKLLCTIIDENEKTYQLIKNLVPISYRNYIGLFGTSVIKANGYRESDLKGLLVNMRMSGKVGNIILSTFKVGGRYSKVDIKEMLRGIYTSLDMTKTPKANDLEEYFELKRSILSKDGKRYEGFEIVKRKD